MGTIGACRDGLPEALVERLADERHVHAGVIVSEDLERNLGDEVGIEIELGRAEAEAAIVAHVCEHEVDGLRFRHAVHIVIDARAIRLVLELRVQELVCTDEPGAQGGEASCSCLE